MDPTAVAIIGWFVQVLFDQGITFVNDHWPRSDAAGDPDLPGAVDSLRHAVKKVSALLSRTRTIRSENEGLLELMKDLKDAAYEADDIFSELDYYRLQQQVLEDDNNSKKSSRGKFMLRVRNLCSCLNATNNSNQASTSSAASSSKDDNKANLVPRIISVVGRLEKITTAIREILPLLKPEESQQNPPVAGHRISTSFPPPKETVIGRVSEKDQIITSLLMPAAASVCVVPIVGMGGVGKTTLARMVYNDEQISKHFDKRIWVCVSDDFDVARLTRDILDGLDVEGWDHLTNLNKLQELLVEKLQSVRYLLVLDDVWNESEREKWGSLCAPLVSQKGGSRILMTTRLDTVVRIAEKSIDMLSPCPLEGLPEDQYLSLFNTYAFGDPNPSHHPSLVDIGKQIAGRLTGSPLAAKTVGGLLREKLDEDHSKSVDQWKSVLNSPIWQLPQNNDDITPALQLSYQHLPPNLQQCFIYCSVFPKDRQFVKDEMVGMWISQGYVHAKSIENKSVEVEEIGSEYFDNLLSRSFIQASDENEDEKKYVLHDLLHDLAESVSENEYLKINLKQKKEMTSSVRHLHVHSNDLSLLQSYNLRNLRTLITDGDESDDYSVLKEVLNGLKSIRVLILKNVSEQLLSGSIGQLTHLRYLAVYCKKSGEGASVLPAATNSMVRLRPYHLQWLISGDGLALPAAAKYLVSLRHFGSVHDYRRGDMWNEIALMSGIGKLTYLQELERFSVGKTEGRKLAQLKRLNELKGTLELRSLHNASTKEEALEANLNKKVGIRKLVLGCGDGHATPHMAKEVFEGLCPPPDIKELALGTYLGVESPTWMMTVNYYLSFLGSLSLHDCRNWKVLPPLGQLPLLRYLWISNADAVEEIGSSFYGSGVAKSFPCLEELYFSSMPEWVVWSGVEEDTDSLFPRLSKLTVWNCPKLTGVPMQCLASVEVLETSCMVLLGELEKLTSLKKLVVQYCEEMQSLPLLPASLVSLKISWCSQLSSLSTTQTELPSLRELTTERCDKLVSIELESLPSLRKITTERCDKLVSVELKSLPSLRELTTERCDELVSIELESLPSLQKITTERCDKLVSIELESLPSLREITIFGCGELVSVELKSLPSLRDIAISSCNQLVSVELKSLPSLRELTILGCNQLVSVELKSLPSLQILKILWCGTIQSVPVLLDTLVELEISYCDMLIAFSGEQEENLSDLTSLRKITIQSCLRLRSLPLMPASLQRLGIGGCPELPRERYQEGGDDWHKISHVPHIDWHRISLEY